MSAILEHPAWPDAPSLTIDPLRESERLEDLRSLKLLDTDPEERFDRITRLAADFFHVPIAYVAFIDRERQWLKSRVGICPTETAREMTFCQYTIHQDEPLIIPDTRLHPVSRGHPAVVGEPYVRFYAGVPLAGPRGHKIGTFCLVDTVPREFGNQDVASLVAFAALVDPIARAARLRTPRTGLRGVKIQPTPGTGFPPINRSSSKSQGCSAWNSWKESFDNTWAPTRSATRSRNASPRPTAPAGGDTSSAWATASSKALRSEGSIR